MYRNLEKHGETWRILRFKYAVPERTCCSKHLEMQSSFAEMNIHKNLCKIRGIKVIHSPIQDGLFGQSVKLYLSDTQNQYHPPPSGKRAHNV